MGLMLLFGLWIVALCVMLHGTHITLKHFNHDRIGCEFHWDYEPVSILKPLKGIESGLEENLESFFKLNYPQFEILFTVEGQDDPVYGMVTSLMKKHSSVKAKLLCGSTEDGLNPKINNMMKGYEAAQNDWIWISDSNTRVDSHYLRRLMTQNQPGVGMISAVVAGQEPRGLGGALEFIALNTFYSRGMMLAVQSGHPCVVGKLMFFRRSMANRFGGIRTLSRYLAEDYMAGIAVQGLGLKLLTSRDPIPQFIGGQSLGKFWSRHLRWGRIRKAHAPLVFLMEPFCGAALSGLAGMVVFHLWFGASPGVFLSLHFLLWLICDAWIASKISLRWHAWFPGIWLLREIIAVPLWVCIAFGKTVQWRGTKLSVESGGILSGRSFG